MFIYKFLIIISLKLNIIVNTEEEFCSIEKNSCSEDKKLEELIGNLLKKFIYLFTLKFLYIFDKKNFTDLNNDYKDYYAAIKQAEDDYQECKAKKCGCFTDVIEQNLKPFKSDRINKKLIDYSLSR